MTAGNFLTLFESLKLTAEAELSDFQLAAVPSQLPSKASRLPEMLQGTLLCSLKRLKRRARRALASDFRAWKQRFTLRSMCWSKISGRE